MASEVNNYGFTEAELDGYVQQNLSPETLQAMEQAIRTDATFKEQMIKRIHLYRLSNNLADYMTASAYRVSGTHATQRTAHYGWAAVMIGLLSIVGMSWWNWQSVHAEKQVKAKIAVTKVLQEAPLMDFDEDSISNEKLRNALMAYRQKENQSVVPCELSFAIEAI
jgi:hypothetical protein